LVAAPLAAAPFVAAATFMAAAPLPLDASLVPAAPLLAAASLPEATPLVDADAPAAADGGDSDAPLPPAAHRTTDGGVCRRTRGVDSGRRRHCRALPAPTAAGAGGHAGGVTNAGADGPPLIVAGG